MIILVEPRLRVAYAINRSKVPLTPWALLSIWSSGDKPLLSDNVLMLLDLRLGSPEVLSVCFDDVEVESEGLRLFSRYHAGLILDFAERARSAHTLIVHCDAGISRSAAVATFLASHFNLDMKQFTRVNPFIVPNQFILNTLNEEKEKRNE